LDSAIFNVVMPKLQPIDSKTFMKSMNQLLVNRYIDLADERKKVYEMQRAKKMEDMIEELSIINMVEENSSAPIPISMLERKANLLHALDNI
jgi:hypothetical protein